MKCIIVSPKNRTVYNFRGDLIKKIIDNGYEVVVTGPNKINVDKIIELGARFIEIPNDKNGVNPFADLKYQKRLKKLFELEKPDVVFGYTSKPVIYGTIAAKKAEKKLKKKVRAVPMVTGVGYAFTADTLKAKLIRFVMSVLYKKAFKKADKVIFQNIDDKRLFENLKLVKPTKAVVVNGSGVNTKKFSLAEYPERTTFLMVGRVMYSKGIREYLEACKIVKKQYPQVRCMLLGACENIQDSISKEELLPYIDDKVIEYFGETDKITDYYKQSSVYVLPSYREGTPRTVLEAASMGRAIITTDAPGCRGTVIDKKTGFIVPIKDSVSLAEKMSEFVKNPTLIQSMGKASAEYCREKYDVEKVNVAMCDFLDIK